MQADLLQVMRMLDSVIVGRNGTTLFRDQDRTSLTNIGVIWEEEILKVKDFAVSTRAISILYQTSTDRWDVPTPAAFRDAVRKVRNDARAKMPALPEADFKREMEPWVKGKVVALLNGDTRAWPEQKEAYDYLQAENPYERTYVWSEQDHITEEDRLAYIEKGKSFSSEEAARILRDIAGGTSARRSVHREDGSQAGLDAQVDARVGSGSESAD